MPSRKGSPNKRPRKTRLMLRLGEDTLSRIAAHQQANQLPSRTAAVEDLAKRGDSIMDINISIKHVGHAVGTIGWLAENAHHISIGKTKTGAQGAWLKDREGNNITVLALGGEEGAHNDDGIEVVTREVGVCPLSCDIYTTDAGWKIIEQLATIAREQMRESEELAVGYKVTLGVA